MARELYRWDGEKMIPVSEMPVTPRLEVITDSLPVGGMWHPVTGQRIHSKAKFRQITRAAGCVEVGNEKQVDRRNWELPGAREAVIETMRELSRR